MGSGGEYQAARERVDAYYAACLAGLVEQVAGAVDRFRAGEIDAHQADRVLHQYHQGARQLWTFCWSGTDLRDVARSIDEPPQGEPVDWWARGAPRTRPAR